MSRTQKLFFGTLLQAAVLSCLVACGDDDTSFAPREGENNGGGQTPGTVVNLTELWKLECGEKNKDDTVLVRFEEGKWFCDGKSWVQTALPLDISPFNPDITYGTLEDDRDGHVYKTVEIGSQTWMAENLNYIPDQHDSSSCFKGDSLYCEVYGRLYTWASAIGKDESDCGKGLDCEYDRIQGVCPDGWHLPSEAEFDTLVAFVGGYAFGGTKLKSARRWRAMGYGTDDVGFSAIPAGFKIAWGSSTADGDYSLGDETQIWSSTQASTTNVFMLHLTQNETEAIRLQGLKDELSSVRCLKD